MFGLKPSFVDGGGRSGSDVPESEIVARSSESSLGKLGEKLS